MKVQISTHTITVTTPCITTGMGSSAPRRGDEGDEGVAARRAKPQEGEGDMRIARCVKYVPQGGGGGKATSHTPTPTPTTPTTTFTSRCM